MSASAIGGLMALARGAWCAVALLLAAAASLEAQVPLDSVVADSIRRDSLYADSLLRRQSMQTDRFLKALASGSVRTPTPPAVGEDGPRADGARIIFTTDSVEWTMANTVGDLIAYVPGSYLWRTGWVGAAELPNFRARGATSVEYYLDGIPYLAVGLDSVTVDPSTMALSLFERIEIEPWPASLRVYLSTKRHDRNAAKSLIGLGRGTNDLTSFEAQLEKRGLKGFGLGIAADYYNSGSNSGSVGDLYRNTQFWLQGSWLPNRKYGIVAQLVHTGPNRENVASVTGSGGVAGLDGGRSDIMLRGFARKRDDGLGPVAALTLSRTTFSSDSLNLSQDLNIVTGSVGWRSLTLGADLSAAWRSRWTPLDLRASTGWTPVTGLGINADAGYQLHEGSRSSAWVGAQASFRPVRQVIARGAVRAASMVQAPSIVTDTAQTVFDASASLGFESRILGAEIGVARVASFQALGFEPLLTVVERFDAAPSTTWITAKGRLTPLNWIAIDAWYSTPQGDAPEGQPSDHAMVVGTIRSKFSRQFPSGVFDFKASMGLERWGDGVLGISPAGTPVTLPSQLYLQFIIQIRIQTFTIFFTRSNLLGETDGYVPGFPVNSRPTMFGARWGFTN